MGDDFKSSGSPDLMVCLWHPQSGLLPLRDQQATSTYYILNRGAYSAGSSASRPYASGPPAFSSLVGI